MQWQWDWETIFGQKKVNGFLSNEGGGQSVCDIYHKNVFGSDRSPRCQDVVCACVCVSGTLFKRTLKMSSSSTLKHPGGVLGQAGRQASRQVSKKAGIQASK